MKIKCIASSSPGSALPFLCDVYAKKERKLCARHEMCGANGHTMTTMAMDTSTGKQQRGSSKRHGILVNEMMTGCFFFLLCPPTMARHARMYRRVPKNSKLCFKPNGWQAGRLMKVAAAPPTTDNRQPPTPSTPSDTTNTR